MSNGSARRGVGGASSAPVSTLSGADLRAAQKELSAAERRMEKVTASIAKVHERLAAHNHTDFEGLQRVSDELRALEAELTQLEERWLELSEHLG